MNAEGPSPRLRCCLAQKMIFIAAACGMTPPVPPCAFAYCQRETREQCAPVILATAFEPPHLAMIEAAGLWRIALIPEHCAINAQKSSLELCYFGYRLFSHGTVNRWHH